MALVSFTSCGDSKMAKELEGEWQAEYTATFSDGEKDETTEYITFSCQETSNNDDGTFVETRHTRTNEMEYGEDTYQLQYTSRVEGTYSVMFGNLYLTYDLSTLQVNVTPHDVKVTPGSLSSALEMMSDAFETLEDPRKDIARESRKEVYSNLFELYQNNSDASFKNLKVNGNTMSYDSEDGDITYTRIK